ncbi:uncharacterized protein [Rutidosis leptorrhynchoides]|uniref:uncharacterized protein n=1 Tax=Rutidosis leptorrhynchoides TaxID=125765 RepID=UPI003A99F804
MAGDDIHFVKRIERLKKDIGTVEDENQTLVRELQPLVAGNVTKGKLVQKLEAEYNAVREENSALKTKKAELTSEIKRLLQERNECEADVRKLSREKDDLIARKESVNGMYTHVKGLVAKVKTERKQTEERHRSILQGLKNKYQRKVRALRQQMDIEKTVGQQALDATADEVNRWKKLVDKQQKEMSIIISKERERKVDLKRNRDVMFDAHQKFESPKKKVDESGLVVENQEHDEELKRDEFESPKKKIDESGMVFENQEKPMLSDVEEDQEKPMLIDAEEIIKVQKEHSSELELLRKELEEVKEQVATVKSRLVFKGE